MTVLEASGKLFDWFSSHDKFNFDDDMSELINKPSLESMAAVKCALEEFEGMDIVKSTEIRDRKYWILKKNFESFDQEVKLSPKTCQTISQLVNAFCKVLEIEDEECDATNVQEKDINNLLSICYHFINADEKIDPSKN